MSSIIISHLFCSQNLPKTSCIIYLFIVYSSSVFIVIHDCCIIYMSRRVQRHCFILFIFLLVFLYILWVIVCRHVVGCCDKRTWTEVCLWFCIDVLLFIWWFPMWLLPRELWSGTCTGASQPHSHLKFIPNLTKMSQNFSDHMAWPQLCP